MPGNWREPTGVEACKAIGKAWCHLPKQSQDDLSNAYAKTYSIYFLWVEGLATPTKAAWDRLWDFLAVIRSEGRRQKVPFFFRAEGGKILPEGTYHPASSAHPHSCAGCTSDPDKWGQQITR